MTDRSKEYGAGIMSENSWFEEFRKMVRLRAGGFTEEEIKIKCVDENLFGMPTERRIKSTFSYIKRRLSFMDDELVRIFCNSDLSTQKLINLIAMLLGDRMFFEFVNEVYRDKYLLGFKEIEKADVNVFFNAKAVDDPALETWNESTFNTIRGRYLNFMTDANLLRQEKMHYYITVPILDDILEDYLKQKGETRIIKAITGVR